MLSLRLISFAAIFLVFGQFTFAATNITSISGNHEGRNHSSPHFLAYSDQDTPGTIGPPAVSSIKGFNVFALSFLLAKGPADKVAKWTSLSSAQRHKIKAEYAQAGISLIISAFGSTEEPTTDGTDPIATANAMAQFVIQYDLDGIDVDYEDFDAFNKGDGKAEAWIISFTTQLRKHLPQGRFIITHALDNIQRLRLGSRRTSGASGGGYLRVHESVGDLIDWYNVQFYNQGDTEYVTCAGLLATSSDQWPQTALFQIAANGVSLTKLVLGKPATPDAADNGFIEPSTLAGCVATAKKGGWHAGVSTWEYPGGNTSWIRTVRNESWPVPV
ncbi:glycoside hydrolase family 18 protein [Mycena pura]|uniref:Glycoside hydrolase family 18 protein n=1 Tax=Mycena pura TaxID=153505 RepID=A0AAD6YN47_9AGAR|nr:glycoside hydrolase family 18 protein [Mycena pura]